MTTAISYAVPDSTTSLFLVIADRPPDESAPSCVGRSADLGRVARRGVAVRPAPGLGVRALG